MIFRVYTCMIYSLLQIVWLWQNHWVRRRTCFELTCSEFLIHVSLLCIKMNFKMHIACESYVDCSSWFLILESTILVCQNLIWFSEFHLVSISEFHLEFHFVSLNLFIFSACVHIVNLLEGDYPMFDLLLNILWNQTFHVMI